MLPSVVYCFIKSKYGTVHSIYSILSLDINTVLILILHINIELCIYFQTF